MEKLHIWGFHCFVPQYLYVEILTRFTVLFGNQDQLRKLSGHYDSLTKLATFEVIAGTTINRDSIRYMESNPYGSSVTITTFSNEDGSGDAHEALFLVVNVGSLPSMVAETIKQQTALWFVGGQINSFHITDNGNMVIVSVVARTDLPDLLVEQISRLVAGWPNYYKNHIAFERQTK